MESIEERKEEKVVAVTDNKRQSGPTASNLVVPVIVVQEEASEPAGVLGAASRLPTVANELVNASGLQLAESDDDEDADPV